MPMAKPMQICKSSGSNKYMPRVHDLNLGVIFSVECDDHLRMRVASGWLSLKSFVYYDCHYDMEFWDSRISASYASTLQLGKEA